jgi:serine protease Do
MGHHFCRRISLNRFVIALAACLALTAASSRSFAAGDESERETPLVRAIARVRPAVVNLRGKKTVRNEAPATGASQATRQVNGMGTGVIIDSRGYLITNYHVVEDVPRIQATLADGQTFTADLIAVDTETDLALLKINTGRPLAVMPLGTSTDLMLAETVAAVGNAYGYEHTVTRGIISELGRTVQVSDAQTYHNLIQTDAPINPGNSGGPLVNLDGEMIGINVAVRVGAQGIAFAIPVNDAIETAGRLVGNLVDQQIAHGIHTRTIYVDNRPVLEIERVDPSSPADQAGLRSGDVIQAVDQMAIERTVDWQCQLIDKRPGDRMQLSVARDGDTTSLTLALGEPVAQWPGRDMAWRDLGIMLKPESPVQLANLHPNYQRGLRIESVRPTSPAFTEGMRAGDVLVAMHGWKTESLDNVSYILQQPDVRQGKTVKFYILRDGEPLWGQIRIDGP